MYAPEFQAQSSYSAYPTYSEPYRTSNANIRSSAAKPDVTQTTYDYTPTEDSPIRKSLRVNFIRKVFAITALQLLVTALFAHFFLSQRWFWKLNSYFSFFVTLSGFVAFIVSAALGLSSTLSRTVPLNYILLTIFTLAQSYCVGFLAGYYSKETVMSAVYMTTAVVTALTLYAMRSKTEITYYGGVMLLLTVAGMGLGFLHWITRIGFLESLSFAGGCVLSGLYLIYDIKLLMGNDRFKLTLDDYISGAMHLYIDIVKVFTEILQTMQTRAEEEEEERRKRRRR